MLNLVLSGKFVSESKFRSDPAAFIPHIENPNPTALDALITKPAVERALLTRLGKKASIYGPEIDLSSGTTNGDDHHGAKWKIDVESVRELYESWIIPLTKEVEVSGGSYFFLLSISPDLSGASDILHLDFYLSGNSKVEYLLHRLDGLSKEEIDALRNQTPQE
jgi:chorismate mutase